MTLKEVMEEAMEGMTPQRAILWCVMAVVWIPLRLAWDMVVADALGVSLARYHAGKYALEEMTKEAPSASTRRPKRSRRRRGA